MATITSTQNVTLPKGYGYVLISPAVSSGTVTLLDDMDIAISDNTPSSSLYGHPMEAGVTFRYSLTNGHQLYVRLDENSPCVVVVTEDA